VFSQCSPAAAAAAAAAVPIAAIGVRAFNGAWLFAKPGPFDGKVDADALCPFQAAFSAAVVSLLQMV
jgi:hypothetical protein